MFYIVSDFVSDMRLNEYKQYSIPVDVMIV